MFALGLLSWLYTRPTDGHRDLPRGQVRRQAPRSSRPTSRRCAPAGTTARRPRTSPSAYEVAPGADAAGHLPQHHRQHRASPTASSPPRTAPACRSSSAPTRSPRPPTSCTRSPALKRFGVTTIQAEDEIAGVGIALGAAFGGALGVTTTSGPGLALKAETIGLAVSLELPLIIVDVQRGGPSHRPADQDRAGRPAAGDVRPQRRVAACRRRAAVAGRLLRRRDRGRAHRHDVPHPGDHPVRRLPRQRLRAVAVPERRRPARPHRSSSRPSPTPSTPRASPSSTRTCATRTPWPGRGRCPAPPGLEHRIGGIEKADVTGNISYDPDNHDRMTRLRQAKIDGIAVPDLEVDDPTGDADVLVLGWGSTYGPIAAGDPAGPRRAGTPVAQAHLRHLNPFPAQPGDVLRALRPRRRARDEPRPARDAAARPLPRRRPVTHRGARPAVPIGRARRRHRPASPRGALVSTPTTTDLGMPGSGLRSVPHLPDEAGADQRGLHLRPGGALVPRVRRLRDPRRRAGLPARAGPAAREHRLRLRHRLLLAVPVLPRHLRHALDPRPGPGDRHRAGRRAARTCRSGSSPATATPCPSVATT